MYQITSSEDADVTEYGSYELQNDQLISINPNAIYLVENSSGCDLRLGSSSLNFQIINTAAAYSLAKMSSGGSNKDTSWEEKVAGLAAGAGMIFRRGFSSDDLELIRLFYLSYPISQISESLIRKLERPISLQTSKSLTQIFTADAGQMHVYLNDAREHWG